MPSQKHNISMQRLQWDLVNAYRHRDPLMPNSRSGANAEMIIVAARALDLPELNAIIDAYLGKSEKGQKIGQNAGEHPVAPGAKKGQKNAEYSYSYTEKKKTYFSNESESTRTRKSSRRKRPKTPMSELTSIDLIEDHVHTFLLDTATAQHTYSLSDDITWAIQQFNTLVPQGFSWRGMSTPLKNIVEHRRDEGEFRTTFTKVLTLACATPFLWDAEEEEFELHLLGMLGKMWAPILEESTAPFAGKTSDKRYLPIRRLWWKSPAEAHISTQHNEQKSLSEVPRPFNDFSPTYRMSVIKSDFDDGFDDADLPF
jgi:hypothetical protein